MAVHLQKGEVVTDPRLRGEAEPCGFYGRTTGTCTISIVRKKIGSTCPFVVPLKLVVAMRKQENMPRECPTRGCTANPWVLNIKTHLARYHPTIAPNTVDMTEYVVVSRDDEKKEQRDNKIFMVMKPKITLKVAKAVDNESASSSKWCLGRSDWQWKPEGDATSVESRSSADHYSSSGNKSSAISEDGNRSSSSSSSSSCTSSSGVEVLLQKKAVPGKCTKRPITTMKQSAKKRCMVKASGRKKYAKLHAHTRHKRMPPPPLTAPHSPSPSLVVACTLRLEGPHNGAGREAWPAIALRASRVAWAN